MLDEWEAFMLNIISPPPRESASLALIEEAIKARPTYDKLAALHESAHIFLPSYTIEKLMQKVPGVAIGRWATSSYTNDYSLLVTCTYLSPNRCVKRRSIIWLGYHWGEGAITLLEPRNTEKYPLLDSPGEVTMLLVQLLDRFIKNLPRT